MPSSATPPDVSARPPLSPAARIGYGVGRRTADTAELKLGIYLAALAVGFALDLAMVGRGGGVTLWACALLSGSGLAIGAVRHGPALRAGALGAAALAAAVPLGPAFIAGDPLGPILSEHPLWPQILVSTFASRVLAEDCEMRFARFWRAPAEATGPVGLQSAGAALALGIAMTLAFYQALFWLVPAVGSAKPGLAAITLAALTGDTAIHRSILLLFFTLLGFLIDAGLSYRRDRAALRMVQRVAKQANANGRPLTVQDFKRLLGTTLREINHLRSLRLLDDACLQAERDASPAGVLVTASFNAFHASARRFVRALLPILPMLGFFGTVVGLATAMAALPTSSPGGAGVDISASLSGLAVKFQTTLLGIMTSLIVSGLLAMLDRGEASLAAECVLLVAEAGHADRDHG